MKQKDFEECLLSLRSTMSTLISSPSVKIDSSLYGFLCSAMYSLDMAYTRIGEFKSDE